MRGRPRRADARAGGALDSPRRGGPAHGSSTRNVAPAPSALRTRIEPPCASTILRLM
ncbi:hypothetical protein WME91_04030 [Sorangium sp. So ce269]